MKWFKSYPESLINTDQLFLFDFCDVLIFYYLYWLIIPYLLFTCLFVYLFIIH